jgi:hypothetical protein
MTTPNYQQTVGPIPVKALHPALRRMILDMREGDGLAPAEDFGNRGTKKYRPREVFVRLQAKLRPTVDVLAYNLNAVNGREVARAERQTDMNSGGEFDTSQLASYEGPVVMAWGCGAASNIAVILGLGITDAGAFYDTVNAINRQIAAGDFTFLHPMVDAALKCQPFPKMVA